MADLTTHYAGLKLKNPLIVSSSGLTKDLIGVKRAYEAGAGAVVLKSVFEEQILMDIKKDKDDLSSFLPEEYEYLTAYSIHDYIDLIENAKKSCDIPIIASINCTSSSAWIGYAKQIQSAGADAVEININILPTKEYGSVKKIEHSYYSKFMGIERSKTQSGESVENVYYDILKNLKSSVDIPVMFKIGPYFTSLMSFTKALDSYGVDALVLFNLFYIPDFNIDTKKLILSMRLSDPHDIGNTLRWIALLHNEVKCDLSATTGVHDSSSCIKLLMSGASSVQICSVLYKKGFEVIKKFLDEISDWMDKNNYATINDLKGSLKKHLDASVFARTQYIKMYSNIE